MNSYQMIPKIIHYCWFGGTELPDLAIKCIESWKKYCPDYKILRWDESNYDIKKNRYMLEAYQNKKWGFVPDYARLDIIYSYGGIYLDTDVELIKSLDDLLYYDAFAGMERLGVVNFGLGFGASKGNSIIKILLDDYDKLKFIRSDGTLNLIPSPQIQTRKLKSLGLIEANINQKIETLQIFSTEYFCPIDYATNVMKRTQNTYSIHHYAASWHTPLQAKFRNLKQRLDRKRIPMGIQRIICFPLRLALAFETGEIRQIIYNKKKNLFHSD